MVNESDESPKGAREQSEDRMGKSWLSESWIRFATAVQFLTRIPIKLPSDGNSSYDPQWFQRSLVCFPLVGGLIGLATAIAFLAAIWVGLSPLVAALIAVGMEAFLTGAFHEDAFADTWDALGGGWSREQILEILKDSRLGTYGTLALVIGTGIRVTSIAEAGSSGALWILASIVSAASLARIAILIMMATTPPFSDRSSKSPTLTDRQPLTTVVVGTLVSLPLWIGWVLLDLRIAILSILVSGIFLFLFRSMILRRVGGTTGDLLGCSAYMTQLAILMLATLR